MEQTLRSVVGIPGVDIPDTPILVPGQRNLSLKYNFWLNLRSGIALRQVVCKLKSAFRSCCPNHLIQKSEIEECLFLTPLLNIEWSPMKGLIENSNRC